MGITVFGRVKVVKALALSKVTHLVQIIPSPPPDQIKKLQRILNNFIWNGSGQKKVVLREGLAQQPPHRGGLGSTHLENFWDSLKMSWLSRLFHANENCTWKKLAMSRLSHAMRIPNLTTNMLLEQGPEALASASKCMANPFWKVVLSRYPQPVPNGYPNPTRYPVFFSLPDPTRYSFENHRVAGNPKYRVLPDISGKPEVSGITRCFGYSQT